MKQNNSKTEEDEILEVFGIRDSDSDNGYSNNSDNNSNNEEQESNSQEETEEVISENETDSDNDSETDSNYMEYSSRKMTRKNLSNRKGGAPKGRFSKKNTEDRMTIEQVGGRGSIRRMSNLNAEINPYENKATYLEHFGAFDKNNNNAFDPTKSSQPGNIHITTNLLTNKTKWDRGKSNKWAFLKEYLGDNYNYDNTGSNFLTSLSNTHHFFLTKQHLISIYNKYSGKELENIGKADNDEFNQFISRIMPLGKETLNNLYELRKNIHNIMVGKILSNGDNLHFVYPRENVRLRSRTESVLYKEPKNIFKNSNLPEYKKLKSLLKTDPLNNPRICFYNYAFGGRASGTGTIYIRYTGHEDNQGKKFNDDEKDFIRNLITNLMDDKNQTKQFYTPGEKTGEPTGEDGESGPKQEKPAEQGNQKTPLPTEIDGITQIIKDLIGNGSFFKSVPIDTNNQGESPIEFAKKTLMVRIEAEMERKYNTSVIPGLGSLEEIIRNTIGSMSFLSSEKNGKPTVVAMPGLESVGVKFDNQQTDNGKYYIPEGGTYNTRDEFSKFINSIELTSEEGTDDHTNKLKNSIITLIQTYMTRNKPGASGQGNGGESGGRPEEQGNGGPLREQLENRPDDPKFVKRGGDGSPLIDLKILLKKLDIIEQKLGENPEQLQRSVVATNTKSGRRPSLISLGKKQKTLPYLAELIQFLSPERKETEEREPKDKNKPSETAASNESSKTTSTINVKHTSINEIYLNSICICKLIHDIRLMVYHDDFDFKLEYITADDGDKEFIKFVTDEAKKNIEIYENHTKVMEVIHRLENIPQLIIKLRKKINENPKKPFFSEAYVKKKPVDLNPNVYYLLEIEGNKYKLVFKTKTEDSTNNPGTTEVTEVTYGEKTVEFEYDTKTELINVTSGLGDGQENATFDTFCYLLFELKNDTNNLLNIAYNEELSKEIKGEPGDSLHTVDSFNVSVVGMVSGESEAGDPGSVNTRLGTQELIEMLKTKRPAAAPPVAAGDTGEAAVETAAGEAAAVETAAPPAAGTPKANMLSEAVETAIQTGAMINVSINSNRFYGRAPGNDDSLYGDGNRIIARPGEGGITIGRSPNEPAKTTTSNADYVIVGRTDSARERSLRRRSLYAVLSPAESSAAGSATGSPVVEDADRGHFIEFLNDLVKGVESDNQNLIHLREFYKKDNKDNFEHVLRIDSFIVIIFFLIYEDTIENINKFEVTDYSTNPPNCVTYFRNLYKKNETFLTTIGIDIEELNRLIPDAKIQEHCDELKKFLKKTVDTTVGEKDNEISDFILKQIINKKTNGEVSSFNYTDDNTGSSIVIMDQINIIIKRNLEILIDTYQLLSGGLESRQALSIASSVHSEHHYHTIAGDEESNRPNPGDYRITIDFSNIFKYQTFNLAQEIQRKPREELNHPTNCDNLVALACDNLNGSLHLITHRGDMSLLNHAKHGGLQITHYLEFYFLDKDDNIVFGESTKQERIDPTRGKRTSVTNMLSRQLKNYFCNPFGKKDKESFYTLYEYLCNSQEMYSPKRYGREYLNKSDHKLLIVAYPIDTWLRRLTHSRKYPNEQKGEGTLHENVIKIKINWDTDNLDDLKKLIIHRLKKQKGKEKEGNKKYETEVLNLIKKNNDFYTFLDNLSKKGNVIISEGMSDGSAGNIKSIFKSVNDLNEKSSMTSTEFNLIVTATDIISGKNNGIVRVNDGNGITVLTPTYDDFPEVVAGSAERPVSDETYQTERNSIVVFNIPQSESNTFYD